MDSENVSGSLINEAAEERFKPDVPYFELYTVIYYAGICVYLHLHRYHGKECGSLQRDEWDSR